MKDNEVSGLIYRLLRGLHQADLTNFGSHLQIVYVASGAQHVEAQINMGACPHPETLPSPPCVEREKETSNLPEVLATEEAMALWKKAQAAGWIDANYQPLISRTQAAMLANAMAKRLKIENKWKVFQDFWKRKNMRSDYTRAQNQIHTLSFQDELKALFVTGT